MIKQHADALWREFPKTLLDFEEQFATEEACRHYLAKCRWPDGPRCARCGHDHVWPERNGQLFECAKCGHQTSLISGTLFHGTRKPLKLWFRAIWEICVHRQGISAADLQRVLGLGSYETAWAWAHRIRRALVREKREPLGGVIQLDETFIGGKTQDKSIVLVAAEEGGRVRLVQAPGNHEACIEHVADTEISPEATVKTDGHVAYNEHTLAKRRHGAKVQTKAEKKANDHLQLCHCGRYGLRSVGLLGTHCDAVSEKHPQSYLDEHAFRHNRRKTKGVGRLVARCLENMIIQQPLTLRQLIRDTYPCRAFEGVAY